MKRTPTQKIICVVVAILFLFNDLCYGLGIAPGSTRPPVQDAMNAAGQKLLAAKRGPGAIGKALQDYNAQPEFKGGEFLGDSAIGAIIQNTNNYQTQFVTPDYDHLPKGGENNPIYSSGSLIEAFTYFRDNEAKIPANRLEIKVGSFPVKEEEGELPIARIEPMPGGKHVLIIHTKFVQMWNHIRENDVLFDINMGKGDRRTVSVAWGIFYRIAKHEMTDFTKKDSTAYKSLGHMTRGVKSSMRDESIANEIEGNYALINDSIWLWFLGSYCFNDNTRYDNDIFLKRINWFFESPEAKDLNIDEELPILSVNPEKRVIANAFAAAINYRFFDRTDVRAFKSLKDLPVDQKLIKEAAERDETRQKAQITEEPLYVTGKNDKKQSASSPAKPPVQEIVSKPNESGELDIQVGQKIYRVVLATKDPLIGALSAESDPLNKLADDVSAISSYDEIVWFNSLTRNEGIVTLCSLTKESECIYIASVNLIKMEQYHDFLIRKKRNEPNEIYRIIDVSKAEVSENQQSQQLSAAKTESDKSTKIEEGGLAPRTVVNIALDLSRPEWWIVNRFLLKRKMAAIYLPIITKTLAVKNPKRLDRIIELLKEQLGKPGINAKDPLLTLELIDDQIVIKNLYRMIDAYEIASVIIASLSLGSDNISPDSHVNEELKAQGMLVNSFESIEKDVWVAGVTIDLNTEKARDKEYIVDVRSGETCRNESNSCHRTDPDKAADRQIRTGPRTGYIFRTLRHKPFQDQYIQTKGHCRRFHKADTI